MHGVSAFTHGFGDYIACAVDHIGVVARTTRHGVGTCTAIEDVVAAVADQAVVQRIASGVDVGAACEAEVFNVRAQHKADRRLHAVCAFAHLLDRGVAEVVNDVGVVAHAAAHAVGTQTTVDHVVACVAGDDVVQCIAGGIQIGAAGEYQVLHVGTQEVADAGADSVGA